MINFKELGERAPKEYEDVNNVPKKAVRVRLIASTSSLATKQKAIIASLYDVTDVKYLRSTTKVTPRIDTVYVTVDSEATYDFLRFYIDNNMQDEWS